MAAGGVARTAGVCGAAAVACLAGGVVGPGVGGVGLIGGGHHDHPQTKPEAVISRPADPTYGSTTEGGPVPGESSVEGPGKFADAGPEPEPDPEPTSKPATPEQKADAEFSPFAGEASGSSPPTSESPAPISRSTPAPTSGSGSAAPSSSGASASGEFGAFK